MGWREAMLDEPAWYVDLLVDGIRSELEAAADVGGEVAEFVPAPDTLESWR